MKKIKIYQVRVKVILESEHGDKYKPIYMCALVSEYSIKEAAEKALDVVKKGYEKEYPTMRVGVAVTSNKRISTDLILFKPRES